MSMYKEEVKNEIKSLKYTCVICGSEFIGYAHSAVPISDTSVCCDSCNNKVIIERLKQLVNK